MRTLTNLVLDNQDENKISTEQRIAVSGNFEGTYIRGGVTIFRRTGQDIVVAVSQNGMLHEALALFETGLEELLHLDGITDSDGYEVHAYDSSLFEPNDFDDYAPMPKRAAIWLKRLPGMFYSETSPIIFEPVRLIPPVYRHLDEDFQFTHVLYSIEREARDHIEYNGTESQWRIA